MGRAVETTLSGTPTLTKLKLESACIILLEADVLKSVRDVVDDRI